MQKLRVGMLGLGNVGGGVAEILKAHRKEISARCGVDIRIVSALVRNTRKKRSGASRGVKLTTKLAEVLSQSDVIVEVMGGQKPALAYVKNALAAGKPVVTANKAIIASDGTTLQRLAARAGVPLLFEAAVAGGVPIIRTMRQGIAADKVSSIAGILNGTTNFILEAMSSGQSYGDALAQAQKAGIAEPDPTLDVTGADAADKLSILARMAFAVQVRPRDIPTVGIKRLRSDAVRDAVDLGYAVKLIAVAARRANDEIELSVGPTLVPMGHSFATVQGSENAIVITSRNLGATTVRGPGAGRLPTGNAIVSDLMEIAANPSQAQPIATLGGLRRVPPKQVKGAYYVHLTVDDRPGVLAAISRVFAGCGISLATVVQREHGTTPVDVVITTHECSQASIDKAAQQIGRLRATRASINVMRIADGIGLV